MNQKTHNFTTQVVEIGSATGPIPTHLFIPETSEPHSAIVLGIEAMGINSFMNQVATDLVQAGYVVAMPDYFRGEGPLEPNNYDDFTDVIARIDALDFRQGTHDLLDTVNYLRQHPKVDPTEIIMWGYCTGGTFAAFAAGLDRDLAGAVLFFPSQMYFSELTAKRPMQLMDILWNINCPTLFLAGEEDHGISSDAVSELEHRLTQWDIEHKICIYEGCGHAFSSPAKQFYNEKAADESWSEAISFAANCIESGNDSYK